MKARTINVRLSPLDGAERTAHLQHRGPFCSVCGRPPGGAQHPYCISCTDIFALPRGQRLYDGDTGRTWFRSTGDGSLVKPECWNETASPGRRSRASNYSTGVAWWILIGVGLAILRGCMQILR
jgi:hypothetical protein